MVDSSLAEQSILVLNGMITNAALFGRRLAPRDNLEPQSA